MRTLTNVAKQKLSQIINVEKFADRDYLLAVSACILLTSKDKNKLHSAEVAQLHQISALADVYSGQFSIRNFALYGITREVAGVIYEFKKEFETVNSQEQIDWLFDKVEALVNDLENISNFKLLRAIRNAEIANEAVLKEIEALENAALVEEAEKTAETAKLLGLPALSGTPKQVAWAEKIRKYCIENLPAEKLGSAPERATTAKYWIENFKHVMPSK